MTSFADQIVRFFTSLKLRIHLPRGIAVMNPYKDPGVMKALNAFYTRYYSDNQQRIPLIGINPGRFGGGVTGISFTDPVNLEYVCGIPNPFTKRIELSSTFIYRVIQRYGPVEVFFHQFFLTAICPLGFMKNGRNYNYYDDKHLADTLRPFIKATFKRQHAICGHPEVAVCLGEGKNFQFMTEINEELKLFKRIHPLPHPRFIMQYKMAQMQDYMKAYIEAFRIIQ